MVEAEIPPDSAPPINAKQGLLFEYVRNFRMCRPETECLVAGGGVSSGYFSLQRAVELAQTMPCYMSRYDGYSTFVGGLTHGLSTATTISAATAGAGTAATTTATDESIHERCSETTRDNTTQRSDVKRCWSRIFTGCPRVYAKWCTGFDVFPHAGATT
jgi:hypothetical protein